MCHSYICMETAAAFLSCVGPRAEHQAEGPISVGPANLFYPARVTNVVVNDAVVLRKHSSSLQQNEVKSEWVATYHFEMLAYNYVSAARSLFRRWFPHHTVHSFSSSPTPKPAPHVLQRHWTLHRIITCCHSIWLLKFELYSSAIR